MKYLYIRLNAFEIITFKSVVTSLENEMIRLFFNGTEGCFYDVKTTDEAEKILNEIMFYLKQDASKYRILDLRNINLD